MRLESSQCIVYVGNIILLTSIYTICF